MRVSVLMYLCSQQKGMALECAPDPRSDFMGQQREMPALREACLALNYGMERRHTPLYLGLYVLQNEYALDIAHAGCWRDAGSSRMGRRLIYPAAISGGTSRTALTSYVSRISRARSNLLHPTLLRICTTLSASLCSFGTSSQLCIFHLGRDFPG